jgi:hypothetical protein
LTPHKPSLRLRSVHCALIACFLAGGASQLQDFG